MQELMPAARALRLLIGNRGVIYLHPLHRDHGSVDGSIDPLRFAGAITSDDGRQNSRGEGQRS